MLFLMALGTVKNRAGWCKSVNPTWGRLRQKWVSGQPDYIVRSCLKKINKGMERRLSG